MINGKRLKELRRNKSISQDELGKIIGVTKTSICCYEKGTRTPTLDNLIDLMEFFGINANYLIGNDQIISIKNEKDSHIIMTQEEVKFIRLLRKDKFLSEVLLENPLRGMELLDKKIK